ncbi:DUF1405 domain-containing protein [Salinicoccus roseus]|uniref:Uncharacterized protein n=1 Tax=Salinicoccus roseus TaxID=45670 RepID=A0A265E8W6_9STAP|nr:DUF1405 domain-containing protein [Salinicoccus roseus]OZT78027.1 hypothetical protein CFN03_01710 [Salinicoccus roseus]RPE54087.1 putative membrane protein YpjA [Salinicoccus roseus]GGA68376.1 membrane protein [Salinicoccus roseus]
MYKIIDLMYNRWFLILLLISNALGTLYGYWWYRGQLSDTEWYFIPFVPDSPTATLFLSVLIIMILIGKKWGLIDALAFTTLIKYGVWAVIMNLLTFMETGFVSWIGLMLIASHGIMAVQALLFLPHLEIRPVHLYITAIWLFHNDIIDYVYGQYPVYGNLSQYQEHIGYFAFWLSVFVLVLLHQLVPRRSD